MQQKKQQKQGKRQEWKEQMKESDRMLKGNVLLEKPQWVLMLTLAAEFLLLVVLHVLVNMFIRFCKGHLADCFSWSCLTTFYPALAPVYIFLIIMAIAVAILNVYRFRNAFRSLEAGQKGTSRFTTMEEIKEQYPAVAEIPEKNPDGSIKRIPGNGGLPVASKDGYMYLDESATNALILAITRAGKGEVFSLRMLDSYSRSEKQPSLIVLDMKFDLRKMCTKAFQDRGYEVMSINLENPMRGVGYNPLYLITRYYQEGRDSDAELLCKAFAYPHFASAGGKSDDNSDFFLSNATSALTATIMAHTVDCIREDTRENARLAALFVAKRQAYERLTEDAKKQAEASKELQALKSAEVTDAVAQVSDGIKADFAGIVTGVKPVDGSNVENGGELFTVSSIEKVCVDVSFSKSDLEKIEEGQKAVATIAGKQYEGTVTRISRAAAKNEKGASIIQGEIHIDNPDTDLYLGVDARVMVEGNKAENVVVIPVEAINIGKDGSFVYVVTDGMVQKRMVTAGISSDEYTEIKKGLEVGEQVIISVDAGIEEGMAVNPVEG